MAECEASQKVSFGRQMILTSAFYLAGFYPASEIPADHLSSHGDQIYCSHLFHALYSDVFVLSDNHCSFHKGPCSFVPWCASQFCTCQCAPARQLCYVAQCKCWRQRYPLSTGPGRHTAVSYWDSSLTDTPAAASFLCQLCGTQPVKTVASPAGQLTVEELHSCNWASLVSYTPGVFDWLQVGWTEFSSMVFPKPKTWCTQPALWMCVCSDL